MQLWPNSIRTSPNLCSYGQFSVNLQGSYIDNNIDVFYLNHPVKIILLLL